MDAKGATQIAKSPFEDEAPREEAAARRPSFLIVVDGGIPGTMYQLNSSGTTVGRSAENGIQVNDTTVSRRHAAFSVDLNGGVGLTDLDSTNGTYLNGLRLKPREPAWVRDGDRIRVGNTIVLKFAVLDPRDERFQRELFDRMVRDSLTGLFHRGYFLEQIGLFEQRTEQAGMGVAVILLDIDHFKIINDTHGHDAGDRVLKAVAQLLRDSTRHDDLVARYGGEEFVIALPVGSAPIAQERAERIRQEIGELRIALRNGALNLTASLGVAVRPPTRNRPLASLITDADEALYQAKRSGRDRTVVRIPDASSCPGRITKSFDINSGTFSAIN